MLVKRFIIGLSVAVWIGLSASLSAADKSASGVDQATVWVTSVAQIGSTDQFVAATADGLLLRESTVMTFDASDTSQLTPLYTHPAAAWVVDASDDGQTIASVDYRGNLVVYDMKSKKPTTHEKAFERWCQAMLVSPDGKQVVAGNEAGKLMLWDLASGKVSKSIELDEHAITGLSISPDATQLAASDGAGHIHLLKWPSLEEVAMIEVSKETLWCVAFSNDGKKLFAGSSDRHLYQSDAKADAKATSVAKGKDWITRIAISPSGQVAASEVGGLLHFPSLGGTDSMEAKSGVWALCWNGDEQLIAGTRKDGLVTAGKTWKWTETKKEEPKKDETTDKPPAKEADKKTDKEKSDAKKPEAPEKEKPKVEEKKVEEKKAGEKKQADAEKKTDAPSAKADDKDPPVEATTTGKETPEKKAAEKKDEKK
ncbi:MAG: hypothetical protein HKN47_08385 [Pirellulaceae bacterium]|nr:hypothetical protein [Pirellulaceae bacterium]